MNLNFPSLQYTALKSCISYQQIHELPTATLFKHLKKIWEDNEVDFLRSQYCDLKIFTVLLDEKYRTTLLQSFSSVNIRSGTPSVADVLLESYKESNAIKNDIELGLKFAQFFIELGNFQPAVNFLVVVMETCYATKNKEMLLECYGQFIYAFSFQYGFKNALNIYVRVMNLGNVVRPLPNCANLFSSISFMHFMLGDYYRARVWAMFAINQLNNQLPTKVIIKVLRLSARVFTINRDYRQARLLIQHALILSKDYMASDPYILAEVYMDYAYYLSQINYNLSSFAAYKLSMKIYKDLYKEPNLYHFLAEKDMVLAVLKYTGMQMPLNKLRIFYELISFHLKHAVQDIIKLRDENHMMHQNSLCDARALNLELYALRLTDIPTDRHKFLTIAKEIHEIALKNHRLIFDEPKKQPSIKTVESLVSIGRVCQYLNEFSNAEKAFKEAETITKTLKCRTNAEYFSVQIHRVKLYRSNPQFFTRKGSILKAIQTMKRCTKKLIEFEGWNCEILDKFYHELIQLYKMNDEKVNEVIKYENLLLEWRTESSLQRFKALTDYLPKTEPMTTIINKIRNMNIEAQNGKFACAIQINRNKNSEI